MSIIIIEIKAKCADPDRIEFLLMQENADYKGIDHQIDTYFNVPSGRLKLREGNIENTLIFYERKNQKGPKTSNVKLYKPGPNPGLKDLLTKSLGILTVVDKKRKIFFIDNIKFHIDMVKGLGSFVEIEAIDTTGEIGKEKLMKQCEQFLEIFNINQAELVSVSYSDLLLKKKDND